MKKSFVILLVAVVFAVPMLSFGAELRGGDDYTLRKGETVSDNLYAGGGTVTIAGDVSGDLVVGGGTMLISGNVSDDVLAGAGTLNIVGSVGGDVRVAGGNIMISGDVKGEVVAVGGTITIVSGAKVGKDIAVAGGKVMIDGDVAGNVKIGGGAVAINGTVGGSVSAHADMLTLGPNASIGGAMEYWSPKEAQLEEGARVIGATDYHKTVAASRKTNADNSKAGFLAFLGAWAMIKFFAYLVAVFLLFYAFRSTVESFAHHAIGSFGKEALRGFAVLVVIPCAIIVLFITLIGFFPGMLGVLAYIALVLFAKIGVPFVLGPLLRRLVKRDGKNVLNWKTALAGVLGSYLLLFIPFVGWIASFAFFLASLGTWSAMLYERVWVAR
jgi:cytoskeletal protein CcmA (bactofilin family)